MFDNVLSVIELVKHLRKTCAWTASQTLASLAPQTLEETYELVDAIEQQDISEIQSELGDLLYHVIFYCQIAEEQGHFQFSDIAHDVLIKHEERMPSEIDRADLDVKGVSDYWDEQKRKQLSAQSSILDGVAKSIPALMRAIKLQNRAAKVGFDWPTIQPVFDKIQEEIDELQEEIVHGDSKDRITEEYGDVLFAVSNLARHLDIEPESALRAANEKFTKRFQFIESRARAEVKHVTQLSLQEMEAYWEESKNLDKKP